ncbi:DNA polymerase III subunit gamma and tau [Kribbella sp. NPDC003505]|uniref:DNA polymerase III subunit gamma and tau n=1 Tax=Kribbella sp. NPDC003505 TaxID=3154448 RepID=UPI0033A9B386
MEAPLALYRRYRPETFAEVIGQDHVTAPLRNALSNNRVNHAYLFSGPRGCGKTTSARILARAINCEKGPIAEPCGVCKSCTDLARGGPGSIDVIEIDAASHGGVDDARDLRERAFFAPVESRYKIYIIDEAHMVTTQGFNALLKLVEEPPPHLKFIFATTEPDKVIGTIRSRTHHYPFRLVPPKVLADYMATLCQSEGVAIEPAALPLVVRAGAGSVRDSLSVLDQLIGGAGPAGVTYELAVALLGFTPDSLLDACVDGFAAHDSAAVFETVEKVIETGQDPKRFAEDLLRRLRDLVVLSAMPTAVTSGLIEAAEDQAERLQTQAAGIGPAELTRAADIVAAGLLEMRGATAPRLQLELICAKVLLPGADDSTNGIQARLDRMERRLAIPSGTPDSATGAVQGTVQGTGTPGPGQTGGMSASAHAGGASGLAQAGGVPGPGQASGGVAGTDSYGDGGAPAAAATSRAAARAAAGAGNRPASSPDDTASAAPTAGSSAPEASVETAGPASPAASAGPGRTAAGTGDRAGQSRDSAAGGPVGASAGARTGAWGDEPAGGPEQPGQSAQPSESTQSGPAGQGASVPGQAGVAAGGGVGLADIRRLWPEVLEAVKAQRRFAWIMLSQNAQVIAIDDQTLTLGLVNAGARESFARSGSDEILRQAMIDSIGVNRRVEAVVDPSADPGAGGGGSAGRPGPQSGGPGQAGGPQSGGRQSGGAVGLGGSGGPGSADGSGSGGVSAGGSGGVGGPGASGPGGPSAGGPAAAASASGAGDPGTGAGGAGGAGADAGRSDAAGMAAGAGGHDGAPDAGGSGAASGVGGAADHAAGSAAGAAGPSAGGGDAADAPGAGARSGGAAGSAGAGAGGGAAAGPAGRAAGGGSAAGAAGHGAGGGAAGPAGRAAGGGGAAASRGRGAAGAGAAGSGAPGVGGRTGAWDDGPGAAIALQEPPDEYDIPPEDPWEDGPIARQQPAAQQAAPAAPAGRQQAGSKRRAAEAAVAAEQARQASAAAAAPDVPLTPEEEADSIGEDDMVLEEDSRSHTDLLRETLGAQIITEEPN